MINSNYIDVSDAITFYQIDFKDSYGEVNGNFFVHLTAFQKNAMKL
jgi:hypothetical protein